MLWGLDVDKVNPGRTMERADGNLNKVELIDQSIDHGYQAPMNTNWLTGRRLDETHMPRNIQLGFGKREKVEPDYIQVHLVRMVSDLFRDLIESVEPGVHQFVSVNAVSRAKKPYEKRYFWFNCCQRVFALDVERNEALLRPFKPKSRVPVNPYDHPEALLFDRVNAPRPWAPVFKADRIGDRQIFVDGDFNVCPLITQNIKEKLETSGLQGFRFEGPYEVV